MICLFAAGIAVQLGTTAMTLRWTHSVEKTVWEEDWSDTPAGLIITTVRVAGSGAGMEPAPDARLENGVWTWTPAMTPLREAILRRSGATADWSVCLRGTCRPMGEFVGPGADPVVVRTCAQDAR